MAVKSFLGADHIDEWRPRSLACRWGDVAGDEAGNNADSSAFSYSDSGNFAGAFDSADSWSSFDGGAFNGGGAQSFDTSGFEGAFDGGGAQSFDTSGFEGAFDGGGAQSFDTGGFEGAFNSAPDFNGTFNSFDVPSGMDLAADFGTPGWTSFDGGLPGVDFQGAPFSGGWGAYNGAPAFEAGSLGGPSWGISGPGDVFGGLYGGLYGQPSETLSGMDLAGDFGRNAAEMGNSLGLVHGMEPATSIGGPTQGRAESGLSANLIGLAPPAALIASIPASILGGTAITGGIVGSMFGDRGAGQMQTPMAQTLPEVSIVSSRDVPNLANPLAQSNFGPAQSSQSQFGLEITSAPSNPQVAQIAPPVAEDVQAPPNTQSAQATPPTSQASAPSNTQANPFATAPPSMAAPAVEASKIGELVGGRAARSLLDMTPQQMNAALLEAAKPGSVQPPTIWDRVTDFFLPSQAEAGDPSKAIADAMQGESPSVQNARNFLVQTSKAGAPGDPVKSTSAPGSTMQQQGIETSIGRLAPAFAERLAAAIQEARAAGIPGLNPFVHSAFRAPSMGANPGYAAVSVHGRGGAADIGGIGAPGSVTSKAWYQIATKNGLYNPYGPYHGKEWNHYQVIPETGRQFSSRTGTTNPRNAPTNMLANWAALGVPAGAPGGIGSDIGAVEGTPPTMTAFGPVAPAPPAPPAQAGRGSGASQDSRSAFGPPHFTAYAPGTGGKMEGGVNASQKGPDGTYRAHTAEDVRAARERGEDDYVTLAKHDKSPYKYGQEINIPTLTYQDRNGKWQTLNNVRGVIHDRGTAKALRGGALDVATFSGKGLTDKEARSLLAQGIKTDAQVAAAPPSALPQSAPPAFQPTAPIANVPGLTAPAFQSPTGSPAGPPGFLPTAPAVSGATGSPPGLPGELPAPPPAQAGGSPPGLPGTYIPNRSEITGSPPGLPGTLPAGLPMPTGSPPGLPGSREFQPIPTGSPAGLPGTYNLILPEPTGSPAGLPGQLPEAPEAPTGSPPGLPGVLPAPPPPPLERGGGSPPGLPGVLPSRGVGATGGSPAGLPGSREFQRIPTGSPAGLPGSESDYGAYGPGEPATGSPGGLPGGESDYSGYGQEGAPVSAMPTAPAAPAQFSGPANPAFKSAPVFSPAQQFDVNQKTISSRFNLTAEDKKSGQDFFKGLTDRERADIINGRIMDVIARRAEQNALRGDYGRMAQLAAKGGLVDFASKSRDFVQEKYRGGVAGLVRDSTHVDMTRPTPSGIQSELARPGGAEVYDDQGTQVAAMPTPPIAPPSVPSWMATPSANTTQPGSLAGMFGSGFIPGGQFPGFTPGGGNFGGRGATGTWDVAAKGDLQPNDFNSRFGDWGGQQAFQPTMQQAQQEAQSNPQQAQQIAQANPQAVQQIAQQYGVDILTAAMMFLSLEELPRFVPPGSNGSDFGRWPQLPTPDFPGQFAGLGREIVRQNYEAQNPINSLASMMESGGMQFNPASWDAVLAHAPYSQNIEDRRNQTMIGMR